MAGQRTPISPRCTWNPHRIAGSADLTNWGRAQCDTHATSLRCQLKGLQLVGGKLAAPSSREAALHLKALIGVHDQLDLPSNSNGHSVGNEECCPQQGAWVLGCLCTRGVTSTTGNSRAAAQRYEVLRMGSAPAQPLVSKSTGTTDPLSGIDRSTVQRPAPGAPAFATGAGLYRSWCGLQVLVMRARTGNAGSMSSGQGVATEPSHTCKTTHAPEICAWNGSACFSTATTCTRLSHAQL